MKTEDMETSAVDMLGSDPTIEYVARIAAIANRIKIKQLRKTMNHRITEGDVWAIIEAVKEIQYEVNISQ